MSKTSYIHVLPFFRQVVEDPALYKMAGWDSVQVGSRVRQMMNAKE
jgi:hypothetical protein